MICWNKYFIRKRSVKRSYDLVAGVYDKLANLFPGDVLQKAQSFYLGKIPQRANILVVGGGTGRILEDITNIYPQGLSIDYVDISIRMIAKAKKRYTGNNKLTFIHQSITDFSKDVQYDVIITAFLLDNFSEATMQKVFVFLHQKLKHGGLWLYTDFQIKSKHPWWQKAVLFIMYSFFRIVCNIEAKQLPDVASSFNTYNYQFIESQTFFHQFIIASVYKKLKDN
jgi:ubiquinone/menaquinone biosynthesis C-methylase UbiE